MLLTLIGLLGGFVLSVILWWILAHGVVPKVSFADGISKIPGTDDQIVYRIQIANQNRLRSVIDVSLRARVYLPGFRLVPSSKVSQTILEIPLDVAHLFVLQKNSLRIMWLELDQVAERYREYLDPKLVDDLSNERDGSLESLLKLSDGGFLLVQALAFDSWSGSRKYFSSRKFTAADVKYATFSGMRLESAPSIPGGSRAERHPAKPS